MMAQMTSFVASCCWALQSRRRTIATAAAGFTAFVNLYALQSILPLLAEVFATDHHGVSLSVGATTLAVALASPLAGWLVGRLPRRQLNALAVAGLVICGLNVAAASTLPELIAWRFLQGLFLPLVIAGVMAFIAEEFPGPRVGRVMANYVAWTIIGGFAGRWLCGLMAAHQGWRGALLLLALLNALSGLVLLLAVPQRPESPLVRPPARGRDLVATLLRVELWPAYLTGFCSLMTLTGVFTYITFYLAGPDFGLNPEQLGRMFCVYLLGIVVTPLMGRRLARVGYAGTLRLAARLSLGGLLLTLIPRVESVLLGLALISMAAFASQSTASSYIAQRGGEQRSLASGLYCGFYYLGGCAGSVLPGFAWSAAGWPGCVLGYLLVQATIVRLARAFGQG
jgi:YNFM family putative membrane transporter